MFNFRNELPTDVKVFGKTYKIDMAYDNVLKMYKVLEDERLKDNEKVSLAIQMLFLELPDFPPKQVYEIWKEAFSILFKDDLKQPKLDLKGNVMPDVTAPKEKVMDMEQDAKYIYSSFMMDYGIDLFEQQGKLHWYKFKSLLDGLSKKTKMREVIEIRTAELPKGKNSQKARQKMESAKRYYALKKDGE